MHTQAYARKANACFADPMSLEWFNRAHNMTNSLIEMLDEPTVDLWLAATFPDGTQCTWRQWSVAVENRMEELREAVHNRIDRQTQAHPGIS